MSHAGHFPVQTMGVMYAPPAPQAAEPDWFEAWLAEFRAARHPRNVRYYSAHRSEMLVKSNAWHRAHPEANREAARRWRASHREQNAAYRREKYWRDKATRCSQGVLGLETA
jgi:hypothetical protein